MLFFFLLTLNISFIVWCKPKKNWFDLFSIVRLNIRDDTHYASFFFLKTKAIFLKLSLILFKTILLIKVQ